MSRNPYDCASYSFPPDILLSHLKLYKDFCSLQELIALNRQVRELILLFFILSGLSSLGVGEVTLDIINVLFQ